MKQVRKKEQKCEYIGCNQKSIRSIKYEISPGVESKVKVCSDHQNQIFNITKSTNQ